MIYTVAALALSNQRMEKTIMNIAVFASHGGSDLQAIMDGCKNNQINAKVAVVISNNGSSMALQRVAGEGIPNYHLSAKKSGSEESLATEILDVLSKYNVDMIFLEGYMRCYIYQFLKDITIKFLIFIRHYYLNLAVKVCLE